MTDFNNIKDLPDTGSAVSDKKFWNKKTAGLIPYVPGEQPGFKCIKLNTNENPYPPSPELTKALASFDIDALRKYPDPSSLNLKAAIAKCYNVSSGKIFVGNGSDEVLAFAFQAFFDRERPVAFADITYSFYPVYAANYNAAVTIIPLNSDFTLPAEQFANSGCGVIIANPNAPTGIPVPLCDIRNIITRNPDRLVIIDEAYIDFGGETAVPLVNEFDNLLVVQTTSKSRSLAGLRLGYAFGSESLIQALECVRDSFNSYTIDTLAQTLGTLAFSDTVWFEETCKAIIAERWRLDMWLKNLGFNVLPSSANFVFAEHPNIHASKLFEALREKGIIVRYFKKDRISNFLRITVGRPDDTDALCNALSEIIDKIQGD